MMLESLSLLTVRELAARLRVSLATAYVLLKQGKIASLRVGGRRGAIRVRERDLEAFLASMVQQVVPSEGVRQPVKVQLRHLKLK